jgi:hypothetical protein
VSHGPRRILPHGYGHALPERRSPRSPRRAARRTSSDRAVKADALDDDDASR